jgi:hypothetical protein
MTVDNSDTATQGRIYDAGINGGIHAFEPDGSPVEGGAFPVFFEACGVGVDPRNGNFWSGGGFSPIRYYTPNGLTTGLIITAEVLPHYTCRMAVDSDGNVYAGGYGGATYKFNSSGEFQYVLDYNGDNGVTVDPSTDNVFVDVGSQVIEYDSSGVQLTSFSFAGGEGVAVNQTNHDVYVATGAGNVEIFSPGPAITLPAATTGPGSDFQPTSVKLDGVVEPEGVATNDCYFEWGEIVNYGHVAPCAEGKVLSGSGADPVSADIGGLTQGAVYHYRLVASNANGTLKGVDRTFSPSAAPSVSELVTNVHSDSALLQATINPGGAGTSFHFEYGMADCSTSSCTSTPTGDAGSGLSPVGRTAQVNGLSSGSTYHYRVVATNQTDTTYGPDQTFTTFPTSTVLNDPCLNAHVRQQTGAALLSDCRAYELVSAADTGGYNVESNLVAGQTPYAGYPDASNPARVLYAVNNGGIPGTNHPTNKGPDPYVATRGEEGWSTVYVGVPANNSFSAAPFSSIPSGADSSLDAFAFGGAGGCAPCFEGGYTGIPVRKPDGGLVQGMAGLLNPGPTAKPDGYVAKNLSANGEHFVFGSTSEFAEGGNDETGDVSIYDHNLKTGETKVISNTPAEVEDFPEPLPCLQGAGNCHSPGDSNGIAELDISGDGSHVLLGQKISTDADGNVYWHLYMDVNDSIRSVDVTPGATSGVLYDGMTADGSEVFFTTRDQLAGGADTDTSADIYQAKVSGSAVTLTRISSGAGSTGNANSCEPVANSNGEHWNTVGSAKNCDVVAIAGGGGIGTGDGTVYFLSPEELTSCGCVEPLLDPVQDQPNLYVARPGQSPRFIATLAPNDPTVLDAVKAAATRETADLEVTPSGTFAAFTTTAPLNEYESRGHSEVYRYDAADEQLQCVSCNPTNAAAEGDASLVSDGLSLADDGRVFFNSTDALAPRDLDETEDAFEWETPGAGSCGPESPNLNPGTGDCLSLISTGSSPFASRLLGVSADGTDAYFFTRDVLVPQDENGKLVKIYDARAGGGFPYTAPSPPCKASDECHGASSAAPPPPAISTITGTRGNHSSIKCKARFVKRHGRCVRKHHHLRRRTAASHKGRGR